jgi:hypothetical protein
MLAERATYYLALGIELSGEPDLERFCIPSGERKLSQPFWLADRCHRNPITPG